MVPDIHSKFHNQPFIMLRAIWRHVFGHIDSLTHSHTIKPPTADVRQVGHTSKNSCTSRLGSYYSPLVHHTIMPHLSVVRPSVGGFRPQISSEFRFPRKPYARFGSNSTIVLTRNQRCALSFVFVRVYSTFTIK